MPACVASTDPAVPIMSVPAEPGASSPAASEEVMPVLTKIAESSLSESAMVMVPPTATPSSLATGTVKLPESVTTGLGVVPSPMMTASTVSGCAPAATGSLSLAVPRSSCAWIDTSSRRLPPAKRPSTVSKAALFSSSV